MSYVTIKKANSPDELEGIKKRLESHGVECKIRNEPPQQVINVVPTPFVELLVKKDQFGKANNILKEFEETK
ncbi:MAG: putative signal transducing protein [Tangfeifania sp.]